jgi:pyruvate formate lyase activating enzyme
MNHEAWMSKPYKGKTVECLACSHHCKIAEGKTGICGVRKNDNGTLNLLVYGKASAINVDPMEKKPLFHFFPGTEVFSFGTVGCNFRCQFCQNWDLSHFHKTHTIEDIIESGKNLSPESAIDFCKKNKIKSIAFTYNEPAIFFEYAYDTAKLAKKNGIHTTYHTNGFETREALEKILPYLDAANIDLKSFNPEFYLKICGAGIEPIKENIRWLHENKVWVEVTTLIIPNQNDSETELQSIAGFLSNISHDLPWHISKYFPAYKFNEPPTPVSTLENAFNIGKKYGLNFVYIGNVFAPEKEDTYCPKCNKTVISRIGYSIRNFLDGNKCPHCGQVIAGRFENTNH